MAINTSSPLTLKALGDHLLQSADLFRNKISNQKDYVLPLLFFKRASDRFHEERAFALADDLPGVPSEAAVAIIESNPGMYHSVIVPTGHFWGDVRSTDTESLGKALNDALREIGRANPKQLAGVFENLDFNNKTALPADDLRAVVDHFHKLGPLTNERVTPDMLGDAYEWLIATFAARAGKGGGEFYTPGMVGKLGARLLAPGATDQAYDPTAGSGGLLLQVLDEARRLHGAESRGVAIFGQELNPETWAIARMNMLLHGAAGAATIEHGDTLKAPRFLRGTALRTFDIIIANPPFSPKNWGHDWLKKAGDPFGRIAHLPPKSHGEIAFVQHMVSSLADTGRMAVVLPNGVFFRGGAELALRKDLVESDLVEAVIELPKDMFYGAGIPACYLLVNKAKQPDRAGKVLFVDASGHFERTEARNTLREADIARIVNAFTEFEPLNGFSAVHETETIRSRGYTLAVRRYVKADAVAEDAVDLDRAVAVYRRAHNERGLLENRLDELLADVSHENSYGVRSMALGEVAQLEVDRVVVEQHRTYRIAGVRIAGEGLFAREELPGAETTYPKLHRLRTGQLVYRKLTAWEGPITVVTEDFEGYFVSPEFPTFSLDDETVLPEFMSLLCRDKEFHREMRSLATGRSLSSRLRRIGSGFSERPPCRAC